MTNTPAHRQQWILEELKKSPLISYVDMWAMYGQKWAKGKTTFDKDWKKAKGKHEAYQKKANEEKERVSIELEKEAVKQGLKTKFDRIMILQNQIEHVQKELALGECEDIKIIKGEPKKIKRPLLPFEKSAMRKNIKDLQAEISKIEGDYAPIKQDHTTQGEKIGNDIITFITIDENGNRIIETSS